MPRPKLHNKPRTITVATRITRLDASVLKIQATERDWTLSHLIAALCAEAVEKILNKDPKIAFAYLRKRAARDRTAELDVKEGASLLTEKTIADFEKQLDKKKTKAA